MKKREFDIFGILLGVVIGCILGFFLSTRINIEAPDNIDETGGQVGNIYLLQIDKVDNPDDAKRIMDKISVKKLYSVAVFDNDYYYIYGGIAITNTDLDDLKLKFEDNGFTPLVKKEYILDKPNSVLENVEANEFWNECVENLIKNLNNQEIIISDKFKDNPINIEVFSFLLALNTIKNPDLLNEIRLNTYEVIIETLG